MHGRLGTLLLMLLAACGRESDSTGTAENPTPEPATRTLRVRVVNEDGDPNPGSALVWWASPGQEFGEAVEVDDDGWAVLTEVSAGPLVLCALPSGFVVPSEGWPRRTVPAGVEEATLVLDIGAERTLRVHGWTPNSTGIAYLAAVGDMEPSQHGVSRDGILQVEGLRPGVRYNLFVRDLEGGGSVLLRGLSADEPWMDVQLSPGKDVTGRVVLPEGCDSAVVAILVERAVLIDGGVTQEDGTFRIRAVPEGTWTVVAYTTLGEKYLASTAEVEAGGAVTLDLTRR
jgi:hypothetical protein